MSRKRCSQRKTREIIAWSYYRGHPTICFQDEQISDEYCSAWRYADSLMKTPEDLDGKGEERPCPKCQRVAEPNGPDPCLGYLPGVKAACCGHGIQNAFVRPYVLLNTGQQLNPVETRAFFEKRCGEELPAI